MRKRINTPDTQKGFAVLPLLFIIAAVALGGVVGFAIYSLPSLVNDVTEAPARVVVNGNWNANIAAACPEDAKICPDGSAVVRTGPNCEFSPCSGEVNTNTAIDVTADWETYTNDLYGFSVRYPNDWAMKEESIPYSGASSTVVYYDHIAFMAPGSTASGFTITMYPRNGDEPPVTTFTRLTAIQLGDAEQRSITISGVEGTKIVMVPAMVPYTAAFLPMVNTTLELGQHGTLTDTQFTQILSTFQFTN